MLIGICGPITVKDLEPYLDNHSGTLSGCPKGMGGSAVTLLAKCLLDTGERLLIFTLDPEVEGEVILSGPRLTIFIGRYRSRARYRCIDFFRAERNYIKKAIQREKPDIMHAHWTYEFALGALASGVPTVVTIRDWAPHVFQLYHNLYRFIRFAMDWQTFRKARHMISNSPYIASLVLERWGKKTPIIPNPIENSFIRSEKKSFPSGALNIVSINTCMDSLKNVESLIRAFKVILMALPDSRLVLIGHDFMPDGKAECWAKKQGLNDGIVYAGFMSRQEIVSILDEAALLVHPSLEESFGNVLVEAMARCVPVVAGKDSGAVPWVLDGGRAGILCDVEDPSSIASAAIGVLTSKSSWTEFSASGNKRVREAFSTTRVVELTLDQYRSVHMEESALS